jgi:Fe-S oxidoreductase
MSGQLGSEGLTSQRVRETMDLCLACKACKAECPSNVDVAKLRSEVLQLHYDRHGATRREKLVAGSAALARRVAGHWWASPLSALVRTRLFRRAFEAWAGVARERLLPAWNRERFHVAWQRQSGQRQSRRPVAQGRRVVLFADTYLECHDAHVGHAAAKLLEGCGYEVELYASGCCQRPRISHGFLHDARREGERTLRELDQYFREGIPVLVCEPSCASALGDDLPDLVLDAELGERAAKGVKMVDVFLAEELEAGRLDAVFSSPFEELLIHGHCHQKALYGTAAMKRLYREVPALTVAEVDSGCCGMAGSFGYEQEHYQLSRKIGEDRLFPALRELSSAAAVVACGTSCREQIRHFAGRQALHWVETLEVNKR